VGKSILTEAIQEVEYKINREISEKYPGIPLLQLPIATWYEEPVIVDPREKSAEGIRDNINREFSDCRKTCPDTYHVHSIWGQTDLGRITKIIESYKQVPENHGRLRQVFPDLTLAVKTYKSGCSATHANDRIDDIGVEVQYMDSAIYFGKRAGDPLYKLRRLILSKPESEVTAEDLELAELYLWGEQHLNKVVAPLTDRAEHLPMLNNYILRSEFPNFKEMPMRANNNYNPALVRNLNNKRNYVDWQILNRALRELPQEMLTGVQDRLVAGAVEAFPSIVVDRI